MEEKFLQEIEQRIGYKFSDRHILVKAFTHSSSVDNRTASNERYEFFGDSVLGMVICQELFEQFEDYLEGDLTKIKSAVVSRRTCALVVEKLDLQQFLKIGRGMAGNRALSGSVAAGLLEAIIAGIYLDGGLEPAKDFILKNFGPFIERAASDQHQDNYKSLLQQHGQQKFNITPFYQLLDEKGPDHNKCFECEAVIGEHHFPSAWGVSKKDAEQKAAYNALVELGVIEEKFEESND